MVFCEAILDELKLNLCSSDNDSDARAREILEGICRNRLALTTWLNKVGHRGRQRRYLIILHPHQSVIPWHRGLTTVSPPCLVLHL